MSKYRIVRELPEGYINSVIIQVYTDIQDKWVELSHTMYKTYYNTFEEAELCVKRIIELDKWKATHGKYQVLKEYD